MNEGKCQRDYVSSGIPFILATDIDNDRLDVIRCKFISKERGKLLQKGFSYAGDVLLTHKGSVGNTVVVPNLESNSIMLTPQVTYYRTKNHSKLNNLYLKCFFQSSQFQKLLKVMAKGATRDYIGIIEQQKLDIVISQNINEQKCIAESISAWDHAIELKEKLQEQKILQNKGLMERLLTGKVRLPGFNDEWKYLKAGEIFSNSSNKKHGGIGEVLSSMQDRGIVPRSQVDIDIKYDAESVTSYKKVEAGDFVISLRSFQGGIEYSEYEGLISPAYTVLKNKKDIDVGFYKELFKSANFIRRLNSVIYGIRDGKQIGYDDFSTLKLPYPPKEEQSAIAKVFQAANDQIAVLQNEITQLKTQKKGLMQLLLTGKVRVPC